MVGEWTWPFEREGFWRYTTMHAESKWVWDTSSPVWKRIRGSTCFRGLSITWPVSLFLPFISKTYRAWCWEIDELVKCIPCNHKGLGLTPTTRVISWVWWSKLIIPALGRWRVPGLLGVPDQWKSLFQEKVARNWQRQRLSFGLCWWVCTYAPPKPQSNYPEPDHVLFLQLKTVAKELVIVVGVRQRLKGKTRRLKLQSVGGGEEVFQHSLAGGGVTGSSTLKWLADVAYSALPFGSGHIPYPRSRWQHQPSPAWLICPCLEGSVRIKKWQVEKTEIQKKRQSHRTDLGGQPSESWICPWLFLIGFIYPNPGVGVGSKRLLYHDPRNKQRNHLLNT